MFVSFCYSSVISFISVYAKSLGLIEASSYFFMVFAVTMMITRPFTGNCMIKSARESSFIRPLSFLRRAFLLALQTAVRCFAIRSCHRHRLRIYHTVPSDLGDPVFAASPERLCNSDLFTLFDTGIAVGSYVSGWLWHKPVFKHLFILRRFVLINLFLYTWSQNLHPQRRSGIYQWLNKPFNLAGPGTPGSFHAG
ncbi:hypothetical protein PO124_27240 [Bacillus licheniformis]|nr:hypothetical protein [Bacillus licheniformis]